MAAEIDKMPGLSAAAWAPIRFPFSEPKAIEAAAVLLQDSGGSMPYMRLIKLIYLADRESLHRFGRPIAGGRYVAMKLGPVTSEILDTIKYSLQGKWAEIIERDGYDVRLKHEIESRLLSEAEISILQETADLFRRLDKWALSDLTHSLPEWRDPGDSAAEISPEDILTALKKSEEEIEDIREDAMEDRYFSQLFADKGRL